VKIRLGFVTNSSSTNFIIAWKGKENDFEDLINKHRDLFPTQYTKFVCHERNYCYETVTDCLLVKKGDILPIKEIVSNFLIGREEWVKWIVSEDGKQDRAEFANPFIKFIDAVLDYIKDMDYGIQTIIGDFFPAEFINEEYGSIACDEIENFFDSDFCLLNFDKIN
jgi:hypothetical protein